MNEVKNYLIYLVCVGLLFLFLFFSVKIFEKKNNIMESRIYALVNQYDVKTIENKDSNVSIKYPKFGYEVLDKKVEEFISQYSSLNNVDIDFSADINRDIITMFFIIRKDDSVSYQNINYSIKSTSFISNNDIYDFNVLGDAVLEKIKYKYSNYVYERVVEDNFKNAYIKVKDGIYIYFNSTLFEGIEHTVYVYFPSTDSDVSSTQDYDKVIAFTFDDGPGNYTVDLAKTLALNDSKATFFELGNRMKYNQEIVLETYNLGMEIASHTYAHKNLNTLSESEIDEEINSTNIIFNEITGDNIGLIRPPYGNANTTVKSRINTPIILWNVDTEDWLSRDSDAVYNHILTHAEDGDIILMHDIYPETLEAVRKVLPVLRERGFKVTTVSELAKEKGITLENAKVYRGF